MATLSLERPATKRRHPRIGTEGVLTITKNWMDDIDEISIQLRNAAEPSVELRGLGLASIEDLDAHLLSIGWMLTSDTPTRTGHDTERVAVFAVKKETS